MKDFAKTKGESKSKWGLKKLIPLWVLAVTAGTLGLIYWDFHKAKEENYNSRWETGYYLRINETTSPFTKEVFTAAKFDKEGQTWVSFAQKNFLRRDYYCVDDKGKDSNVPDGLADRVEIGRKRFERKDDYESNKDLFHKADEHITSTKNKIFRIY